MPINSNEQTQFSVTVANRTAHLSLPTLQKLTLTAFEICFFAIWPDAAFCQ